MVYRRVLILGLALLLSLIVLGPGVVQANSIASPDTAGDVGEYTSLALDAAGNPVVSYFDFTNLDLKVMHCNDPNCEGGGESITSPDTAGNVGQDTSLALDAAGHPVVTYHDATSGDLKVMHCNDPNCEGGGESITSPDTDGSVGWDTSLALDAVGHPVVTYYDATNGDLKVMHCNDANCFGGGESITSPDTAGDVGEYTSLALDAAGNPVVSYYDRSNGDLKVMHCNDPNCAGGGESITSPDTAGDVGLATSLALDADGRPVIGYFDESNVDLKILHCNDPNCAGADESITSPDTDGLVGADTSLALDTDGNPVISYHHLGYNYLKVMHCNDPNCAGGGESILSPDRAGSVGRYTSLALDADGFPVVSYYDRSNGDLKILRCDSVDCTTVKGSISSPDPTGAVGRFTSLAMDSDRYPVVSYYDATSGDLKVLHCNDPNCAGGGESITSPDTAGDVGLDTSLALDAAGHPVVSYYDITGADLKVMHCSDPNCDPTVAGAESVTSPDTAGAVGGDTSLALDGAGYPVVSYADFSNGDLTVMHCNDADCAGGDESITSPDTAGIVGWDTSLALDDAGNPVVTYYDATNGDLKVLHCNDANCTGGDESITSPDTAGDVGSYTSLALDADGYPVVAYYDTTNGDLKVMHCNDPNCAGGDESVTSPDAAGDVGWDTSLVLDDDGYPVVSHYDNTNGDLKVIHCNDANCAGGDESITRPDTAGAVGRHNSLALDDAGNPVVSYYDDTDNIDDLRILHCFNAYCSLNLAPEVDAGADQTAVEGEQVSFAGSASDPEGDPLDIQWNFGDGSTAAGSLTTEHAYADDGSYVVTLTVTDDDGGAASDTLVVTVEEAEQLLYLPNVLRRP